MVAETETQLNETDVMDKAQVQPWSGPSNQSISDKANIFYLLFS